MTRWRAFATAGMVCGALISGTAAGAAASAPERGTPWASLSLAQQQTLAPLQRDWADIDANRKQKWIEVAGRFPSMPPDERRRVQERMAEWARMTPAERASARMQFQQVRKLPVEERQARWQAYQALSPDERKQLAQQALPALRAALAGDSNVKARSGSEVATPKRNLVQATVTALPSRTVAPSVMQAKPGATTTTMSTRAAPPPHHQPGLPKIAATPGFVDPATLLPQRGPQGAAVRAAASADPAVQP